MDMDPQAQYDLVNLAGASSAAIRAFIDTFRQLWPQAAKEGVSIVVFPPLEHFGAWLVADASRIKQGEDTLKHVPPPKLLAWATISIVIGLDTTSSFNFCHSISRNNFLLTAFIFLTACTICFGTDTTTELMLELMRLNGTLRVFPVPRQEWVPLIQALGGCCEYLVGESPNHVFDTIATKVNHHMGLQGRRIDDLYNAADMKSLASLIYETFEKIKNADFEFVILEGTRNGIWVASLFVWLLPNEVEVMLHDDMIYPDELPGQGNGNIAKLIIRIRMPEGNCCSDPKWIVRGVNKTEESVPVVINLFDETMLTNYDKQHRSPLRSARRQIMSTEPDGDVVDDMGHLAAALVVLAVENGILINKSGVKQQPFINLCSEDFLGSYSSITGRFGWEGRIDTNRRQQMTSAILAAAEGNPNAETLYSRDNLSSFETLLSSACVSYESKVGQPMLRSSTMRGEKVEKVFHFAIYLAGEALLYAFCAEKPKNAFYRPIEPFKLQEHSFLVGTLLGGIKQPTPEPTPTGYSFWELRRHAIEALLPGAVDVNSADLAIAGNGYVVFSAGLADWDSDRQLTRRRAICSIYLSPGPLKALSVEGKLLKVTEKQDVALLASRLVSTRSNIVRIYDGGRFHLDERESIGTSYPRFMHLWTIENLSAALQVTTYMQITSSEANLASAGTELKIPAKWEQSIDAIAFSHHIETLEDCSPKQLSALAAEWQTSGRLGENVQWCSLGAGANTRTSYVTVTSHFERARFFEAGNLSTDHTIYIRQMSVPLIQCIKTAMSDNHDGSRWIIIA